MGCCIRLSRSVPVVRQLLLIIGFVLVCGSAYADGYISCDVADGWSYDAVNGWMETGNLSSDNRVTLDGGHGTQTMSQDSSGYTGECCQVDITAYGEDGDWKIYPLYKAASGCIFQNGAGYNRAYFYAKVPKLTGTDRYTFHFGTYSKDPTIGKCECSNDGNHFYHYYERIIGSSDYWMKVYVDLHPQHEVNEKTDPGNNPTMNKATTCYPDNFATEGWDYFAGMTRAYWEMKYSPWDNNEAEWSAYTCYFDDYTWYNETYDENTTSINSVLIEYWGDGHFRLNWAGVSQYVEHTQRYEVKYSTSQITSENWASASYPSDMPSGGYGAENVGHYNNDYHADFTIPGFNEDTTIYFAIKDITPGGDDRLKRVDYLVSGESGNYSPVATTISIINSGIRGGGGVR